MENSSYAFTAFDFPSETPANAFLAIKITALPSAGTLTDNGTAVALGQYICIGDINAGDLVYTPAADGYGDAYDSFAFLIKDANGTNNGSLESATQTMNLNVAQS